MTGLHTLLAATDLSGPARHAVERAALLAREHEGARLFLFHAVNRSALTSLQGLLDPSIEAEMNQRLVAAAEAQLVDLAQRVHEQYGLVAASQAGVGDALEAIVEAGARLQADLLVMGARGAGFVRELLIGSTTERILRKSGRPVLAVKQHPHEAYRRVLVPMDFSRHALAALQLAATVAPQAEIILCHAYQVEMAAQLEYVGVDEVTLNHYRERAKELAGLEMETLIADQEPALQGRLRRTLVHGPASIRILEKEQDMDADLIVMGKRGQSMLEEMLLGSVTKHVLAYSQCDVLVASSR